MDFTALNTSDLIKILPELLEQQDVQPRITKAVCEYLTSLDDREVTSIVLREFASLVSPSPIITEHVVNLLPFLSDPLPIIHVLPQFLSGTIAECSLILAAYKDLLKSDRCLLIPILGSLADMSFPPSLRTTVLSIAVDAMRVVTDSDLPAASQALFSSLPSTSSLQTLAQTVIDQGIAWQCPNCVTILDRLSLAPTSSKLCICGSGNVFHDNPVTSSPSVVLSSDPLCHALETFRFQTRSCSPEVLPLVVRVAVSFLTRSTLGATIYLLLLLHTTSTGKTKTTGSLPGHPPLASSPPPSASTPLSGSSRLPMDAHSACHLASWSLVDFCIALRLCETGPLSLLATSVFLRSFYCRNSISGTVTTRSTVPTFSKLLSSPHLHPLHPILSGGATVLVRTLIVHTSTLHASLVHSSVRRKFHAFTAAQSYQSFLNEDMTTGTTTPSDRDYVSDHQQQQGVPHTRPHHLRPPTLDKPQLSSSTSTVPAWDAPPHDSIQHCMVLRNTLRQLTMPSHFLLHPWLSFPDHHFHVSASSRSLPAPRLLPFDQDDLPPVTSIHTSVLCASSSSPSPSPSPSPSSLPTSESSSSSSSSLPSPSMDTVTVYVSSSISLALSITMTVARAVCRSIPMAEAAITRLLLRYIGTCISHVRTLRPCWSAESPSSGVPTPSHASKVPPSFESNQDGHSWSSRTNEIASGKGRDGDPLFNATLPSTPLPHHTGLPCGRTAFSSVPMTRPFTWVSVVASTVLQFLCADPVIGTTLSSGRWHEIDECMSGLVLSMEQYELRMERRSNDAGKGQGGLCGTSISGSNGSANVIGNGNVSNTMDDTCELYHAQVTTFAWQALRSLCASLALCSMHEAIAQQRRNDMPRDTSCSSASISSSSSSSSSSFSPSYPSSFLSSPRASSTQPHSVSLASSPLFSRLRLRFQKDLSIPRWTRRTVSLYLGLELFSLTEAFDPRPRRAHNDNNSTSSSSHHDHNHSHNHNQNHNHHRHHNSTDISRALISLAHESLSMLTMHHPRVGSQLDEYDLGDCQSSMSDDGFDQVDQVQWRDNVLGADTLPDHPHRHHSNYLGRIMAEQLITTWVQHAITAVEAISPTGGPPSQPSHSLGNGGTTGSLCPIALPPMLTNFASFSLLESTMNLYLSFLVNSQHGTTSSLLSATLQSPTSSNATSSSAASSSSSSSVPPNRVTNYYGLSTSPSRLSCSSSSSSTLRLTPWRFLGMTRQSMGNQPQHAFPSLGACLTPQTLGVLRAFVTAHLRYACVSRLHHTRPSSLADVESLFSHPTPSASMTSPSPMRPTTSSILESNVVDWLTASIELPSEPTLVFEQKVTASNQQASLVTHCTFAVAQELEKASCLILCAHIYMAILQAYWDAFTSIFVITSTEGVGTKDIQSEDQTTCNVPPMIAPTPSNTMAKIILYRLLTVYDITSQAKICISNCYKLLRQLHQRVQYPDHNDSHKQFVTEISRRVPFLQDSLACLPEPPASLMITLLPFSLDFLPYSSSMPSSPHSPLSVLSFRLAYHLSLDHLLVPLLRTVSVPHLTNPLASTSMLSGASPPPGTISMQPDYWKAISLLHQPPSLSVYLSFASSLSPVLDMISTQCRRVIDALRSCSVPLSELLLEDVANDVADDHDGDLTVSLDSHGPNGSLERLETVLNKVLSYVSVFRPPSAFPTSNQAAEQRRTLVTHSAPSSLLDHLTSNRPLVPLLRAFTTPLPLWDLDMLSLTASFGQMMNCDNLNLSPSLSSKAAFETSPLSVAVSNGWPHAAADSSEDEGDDPTSSQTALLPAKRLYSSTKEHNHLHETDFGQPQQKRPRSTTNESPSNSSFARDQGGTDSQGTQGIPHGLQRLRCPVSLIHTSLSKMLATLTCVTLESWASVESFRTTNIFVSNWSISLCIRRGALGPGTTDNQHDIPMFTPLPPHSVSPVPSSGPSFSLSPPAPTPIPPHPESALFNRSLLCQAIHLLASSTHLLHILPTALSVLPKHSHHASEMNPTSLRDLLISLYKSIYVSQSAIAANSSDLPVVLTSLAIASIFTTTWPLSSSPDSGTPSHASLSIGNDAAMRFIQSLRHVSPFCSTGDRSVAYFRLPYLHVPHLLTNLGFVKSSLAFVSPLLTESFIKLLGVSAPRPPVLLEYNTILNEGNQTAKTRLGILLSNAFDMSPTDREKSVALPLRHLPYKTLHSISARLGTSIDPQVTWLITHCIHLLTPDKFSAVFSLLLSAIRRLIGLDDGSDLTSASTDPSAQSRSIPTTTSAPLSTFTYTGWSEGGIHPILRTLTLATVDLFLDLLLQSLLIFSSTTFSHYDPLRPPPNCLSQTSDSPNLSRSDQASLDVPWHASFSDMAREVLVESEAKEDLRPLLFSCYSVCYACDALTLCADTLSYCWHPLSHIEALYAYETDTDPRLLAARGSSTPFSGLYCHHPTTHPPSSLSTSGVDTTGPSLFRPMEDIIVPSLLLPIPRPPLHPVACSHPFDSKSGSWGTTTTLARDKNGEIAIRLLPAGVSSSLRRRHRSIDTSLAVTLRCIAVCVKVMVESLDKKARENVSLNSNSKTKERPSMLRACVNGLVIRTVRASESVMRFMAMRQRKGTAAKGNNKGKWKRTHRSKPDAKGSEVTLGTGKRQLTMNKTDQTKLDETVIAALASLGSDNKSSGGGDDDDDDDDDNDADVLEDGSGNDGFGGSQADDQDHGSGHQLGGRSTAASRQAPPLHHVKAPLTQLKSALEGLVELVEDMGRVYHVNATDRFHHCDGNPSSVLAERYLPYLCAASWTDNTIASWLNTCCVPAVLPKTKISSQPLGPSLQPQLTISAGSTPTLLNDQLTSSTRVSSGDRVPMPTHGQSGTSDEKPKKRITPIKLS